MLLLNENESVASAPRIHSQAAFVRSAVSETVKLLDIDTAIATTAASISPMTWRNCGRVQGACTVSSF